MPVIGFGFIEVLEPLLQLAVFADLQRRQPIPRCQHSGAERLIHVKQFRCLNGSREQGVNEDAVAGCSHGV